MLNFFRRRAINSILLSATLIFYAISAPVQCFAYAPSPQDIIFTAKLGKSIDKFLKIKSKSYKDIIDGMLGVKQQIESHYNVKFNMSEFIDLVENGMRQDGYKVSHDHMSQIRKMIISRSNKNKSKCKKFNFWQVDEDAYFDASFLHDFKHESKDSEKEPFEDVPCQLVFGVTIALCGFFIMRLPIPGCFDWGARLVAAGFAMSANACAASCEEDRKKKKSH